MPTEARIGLVLGLGAAVAGFCSGNHLLGLGGLLGTAAALHFGGANPLQAFQASTWRKAQPAMGSADPEALTDPRYQALVKGQWQIMDGAEVENLLT